MDLSKLKPIELPKKTVEVKINGEVQEQEIRPLTGSARIESWAHSNGADIGESTERRVEIALIHGAGLSELNAKMMIDIDWFAAVNLSNEVYGFTNEYEVSRAREADDAKKNSSKEEETN